MWYLTHISIHIISFVSSPFFGSQNIVHGDIKPDNLLVSATGTVKIGDFSVSQVFEVIINKLLCSVFPC